MTDTNVAVSPSRPRPDADHRVPADERVLGFDRRTIWPGVVLLVVWAVWAHLMPWIDQQISVDNPIVEGDVVNLGFGEVTFLPAVGWNLESGRLLIEGEDDLVSIPSSASLSSETIGYQVHVGNWDGSAEELADQMIDVNEGLDLLLGSDEQGRTQIQNADGAPGELVYVVGADQAALIVTFVFEPDEGATGATAPFGVEIEVRGSPENLKDQVEEIARMIDSTTYRPSGQEENP